jgi:glycosyltransferase involved in cell wall biosynthesis
VGDQSSELRGSRRVVATAEGWADGRSDVLVHAASQLPDAVSVAIGAQPGEAASVTSLASAYGISDRVLIDRDGARSGATAVVKAEAGSRRGGLGWTLETSNGSVRPVDTMADLVERLYVAGDPPASRREQDEIFSGHRVVVVTNLPTHYRVPLFNRVAERLARAGGELHVLFTSQIKRSARDWLRHAPIDFEHRFLSSGGTRLGEKAPIDLGQALRGLQPDAVVAAGFAPFIAGRVAGYADRRKVSFGIWSGETHRQRTARSRARRIERAWIARRAGFGIAYGWLSREYLRDLRPDLPVVIGRNTAPLLDEPKMPADRPAVEFLAVAQAIRRKGLDVVVDAFKLLGEGEWRLTVAGGGSELEALKARAGGAEQIRFLGAVPSDRILECYREAEIFLFPSRSDVFGLTLVEAMGGGLATITAASPGAVPDLAVDGDNCLIVDEYEPELWAQAVRRLADDSSLRDALAGNGRETVLRRWTMEHSVDAWLAGVRLGLLETAT